MKYLTLLILLFSLNIQAQEREGDLALPVTDLEIEKQEEELPPTIEEVEMQDGNTKKENHSSDYRNGRKRTDGREDSQRRKY